MNYNENNKYMKHEIRKRGEGHIDPASVRTMRVWCIYFKKYDSSTH
jgi:hypothetical protein